MLTLVRSSGRTLVSNRDASTAPTAAMRRLIRSCLAGICIDDSDALPNPTVERCGSLPGDSQPCLRQGPTGCFGARLPMTRPRPRCCRSTVPSRYRTFM